MKNFVYIIAISLTLFGNASADALYTSGGFTLATQGVQPKSYVHTGSSEGVDTLFSLSQKSTLNSIVFGSSLDATAFEPSNWSFKPSISIFSMSGESKAYASSLGSPASVTPGNYFNFVKFAVDNVVLDAGSYRIFWAYGPSEMPFYATQGESITYSNPAYQYTLDNTSLAFQVQGVSAVPEPQNSAMWLAGLGLLAGLARYRRISAGISRM
jgi:hypothetical protein